jgi:hypothetical protein
LFFVVFFRLGGVGVFCWWVSASCCGAGSFLCKREKGGSRLPRAQLKLTTHPLGHRLDQELGACFAFVWVFLGGGRCVFERRGVVGTARPCEVTDANAPIAARQRMMCLNSRTGLAPDRRKRRDMVQGPGGAAPAGGPRKEREELSRGISSIVRGREEMGVACLEVVCGWSSRCRLCGVSVEGRFCACAGRI